MRSISEKYATFIGGAKNHRLDLSENYMIKDNFISLDIMNIGALESIYKQFNPDIIINCIAYTNVDKINFVDPSIPCLTNTPNDNVTSMLNITTRSKIHNSIFLNI